MNEAEARRVGAVLLSVAAMLQSGCLFARNTGPEKDRGPTAAEKREARAKKETDDRAAQLAAIKELPARPNPFSSPKETNNSGTQIGPTYRWNNGKMDLGRRNPLLEMKVKSYSDDTLCLDLHSQHGGTSDEAPLPSPDLHARYHLWAPTSLTTHFSETTSIDGSSFKQNTYDARKHGSTLEPGRNGSMHKIDHYDVDETFEVCFAQASRVLGATSSYMVVSFTSESGSTEFWYVWRF